MCLYTSKTREQVSVSPQENLRDVEGNHLVEEERYLRAVGLGAGGGSDAPRNTTTPALVTYASGDAHALAVSFVRHAASLPYTVLIYNLGLKPYSLAVVCIFFMRILVACVTKGISFGINFYIDNPNVFPVFIWHEKKLFYNTWFALFLLLSIW